MMTLVASALAGGDCINDADARRRRRDCPRARFHRYGQGGSYALASVAEGAAWEGAGVDALVDNDVAVDYDVVDAGG